MRWKEVKVEKGEKLGEIKEKENSDDEFEPSDW